MGSFCSSGARELVDADEKEDTEDNVKEVTEKGFINERRCTDVLCLIIWVLYILFFIVVSLLGFRDGNPTKLYKPRDYQGAYCGTEENWNNGPNLLDQTKLGYMMNVTSSAETVMMQLMCSTTVRDFLQGSNGFSDNNQLEIYLCECCYSPCATCDGSLNLGGDITGPLSAATLSSITDKMRDLTDPSNAVALFSPAGANGDFFNNIWDEATKYFIETCIPSCELDPTELVDNGTSASSARTYTYKPSSDHIMRPAWDKVASHFAGESFMSAFDFSAYPVSICPYPAEHCVPMPGVEMVEVANGYCAFSMTADVIETVGNALSSTFVSLGGDSFAESATENFGAWLGDFQKSIDTFVLTCVCSFVVGIIFLVILRFTIGYCVWIAIFLIFFSFVCGGYLTFIRAIQCKDASIFTTGRQTAVAITVAGTSAASDLVTGSDVSEAIEGDGAAYRGHQTRTRNGLLCQGWEETTPWDFSASYSPTIFPDSGLAGNNYCRNPYSDNTSAPARTIWCFTTSPDVRWEICSPIGVIAPECEHGYAVSGENMREALKITAYVIWGFAGVFVLLVLCLMSRIRLAIALNKVAAQFLASTPSVLIVPVVQSFVGCAWVLGWMMAASYLLSQVPDSYIPTESYATYADAYGTADIPGNCTDKWPTGFVWKAAQEDCDGDCWRCAPPRFILDWRFAVSFFAFLWNNAFLVALGQCMIAGAVGVWFFTDNERKGKLSMCKALRTANWNVWRYHAGSLAFGSFILALVQFIRYLMKYFEKNAAAQKNRVMVYILKAVQCCLRCFERFIEFLNKNAYIQIAIRGTPFCTSAKKAWTIITKNLLRFGTVAVLGGAVQSIGVVFIMAATMVSGYFLLQQMHDDISPLVPLIVYFFMSYVVANLFMNVFGLAVDTCLQCVIFAEEKCPTGSFVPKCLRNVIDKTSAEEEGTV